MKFRRFILIIIASLSLLMLSSCATANQAAQEGGGSSESKVAKDQTDANSEGKEAKKKPQENVEILNKGFSQLRPDSIGNSYVSYGAILKNPNGSEIAEDVSVNITFFDAKGTVVKSVSETVSVILPNQAVAVGDSAEAKGAIKMEIQALVGDWTEASGSQGAFTVEGINTVPEEYGGMKTNATLASTFKKDLENVEAVAIYFNGGKVMGGASTFVDFAPAGGKVGLEISGMHTIPNVNRTEIFVGLSSLTLLGIED